MRRVLFLIVSVPLYAQSVQIGVEGGIPLTNAFTAPGVTPPGPFAFVPNAGTQRTLPYLVGPKVEIHLWRPLYLDAEGLYGRADYAYSTGQFLKHTVDQWKVPVLLKAQFNSQHFVRPFVSGGVSFQRSADSIASPPVGGFQPAPPAFISSAIGATFAAGAGFGTQRVRPSIELRYTRWSERPVDLSAPTVRSKQDEVQLLAGLTFGVGKSRSDSVGVLEGPLPRRVSLGIKGGLLATDALTVRFNEFPNLQFFGTCGECGTARTLPYVIGPAVEVRIAGGFSATAEALYSRAVYNHTTTPALAETTLEEKHTVDRWEAPFLLKYAFKTRRLSPFISGGASVQYNRDSNLGGFAVEHIVRALTPPPVRVVPLSPGATLGSFVAGPTAGLGVSFYSGRRVRATIEGRYTYWTDYAIAVGPPPAFGVSYYPPTITSIHNQVQILLGFMF
jgi:hypothetical protein